MFSKKQLSVLVFSALASQFANAACDKSYAFAVDISGGATGSEVCSAKVDSFLDALKNFDLSNASYNGTQAVNITAKFSDVPMTLAYPTANNATLTFTSAALGVNKTFLGATRDESQRLFEDYVKKTNILGQIMKYQANNSAVSPISGVAGLIPSTAASDFSAGFTSTASNIATPAASTGQGSQQVNNLVGAALSFSSMNVSKGGDKVDTVTLPLSYTYRSDSDPRKQLIFSLPVSQTTVGDAKSYQVGLGIAYKFPVTDRWSLTPGIKYSVVASADQATVASVYSGSLTSTYLIPMDGYTLGVGNMVGYYKTGNFSSGEYSFDPDIEQVMTRNGVMLSQPVSLFGQKLALEYSVIDTRYLSNAPYIKDMQEFGITLGTNKNGAASKSFLRAGVSFITAKDSNGVMANFGYWF